MPYRLDVARADDDTVNRLIELGALDVEISPVGAVAALMPDSVGPEQVKDTLRGGPLAISPAVGRDANSVWVLRPRPIQIGRLRILPADMNAEPGALRLIDAPAFGTGLHPTTALCIEMLHDLVDVSRPDAVLDVGTGSGVLALAALALGVPRVVGIDADEGALRVASENARLNGVERRLQLAHGQPAAVDGTWPLVLANILAAPLIEMAPSLVRRIGHHGRLVLSGVACAVEQDVDQAYVRLGMRRLDATSRDGWTALLMQASW